MCGGGDEPKQTPEEAELGRIAVEKWNHYQTKYVPVENEYIEDVQMGESDFAQARGTTAASVQMGFDQAEVDLSNNIFAQGLDVNSSQFISAIDDLGLDRGLSMGTGLNETEMAVDNKHVMGLQSVVDMGQGKSARAVQGMGEIAGMRTHDAIDRANRSFQEKQAGLHLVGNVAGAGASHYMNASPGVNMQGQETPLYNNTAYVKNF